MVFDDKLVSNNELISVKRKRSLIHIFDKFEVELQIKRESEGWLVDKVLKNKVRMKKLKPSDEQFEDEVWLLCASLGFTHLNKDRNLNISYGSQDTNTTKQIDVLAIDNETILIIECKCSRTGKKISFKDEIEALHGIREGLSKSVRRSFPGRKVKCIFATKHYDVSDSDKNRMKELGIQHFDHVAIKYFSELAKHLGKCARYQFLGHLFDGQKIPFDNKIPAIRGKMGGYTYYSFSIEPEKLLKIAYVLHRNEANEGMMPTYQRIIKKSRLNDIQRFVNRGGFFPNSVIVNIDTRGKTLQFDFASTQVESSIAQIGILHLPQQYRSAYVIDGQHRLYGYADSKYCETNSIPVVAFINLAQSKQVDLFMEINENQKTISKNLKNTLNADLLWESDDLNQRRKALRLDIAQKLGDIASSPLYECIIVGENEITPTRCITLDTIDSALKATNFLNKYNNSNLVIASGTFDTGDNEATRKNLLAFLINCFDHIRENLEVEWTKGERDSGVLTINNSVQALIRIFNDIINLLILRENINPKVDSPDDIAKKVEYYLAPLIKYFSSIKEDQRKEIKSSYGSGGKVKVWRLFEKIIKEFRPEFNPVGLEQWIKDNTKQFNLESQSMILDIRNALSKDFATKLETRYGVKWIMSGLPLKVQQQANSIMVKKNYEGNEVSLWDCVSIIHLREIATFGPHWTELFSDTYTLPNEIRISGGKVAKTEWFARLAKLSNNTSSSTYSVSEDDYKFLQYLHQCFVK